MRIALWSRIEVAAGSKFETQNSFVTLIMRPSSLGGGRIIYASHSVCLSVCLSVRPVIVTERHVAPPSELQ